MTKRLGIFGLILALSVFAAHAAPEKQGGEEVLPGPVSSRGFAKNAGQIQNTDGNPCPEVLYTASRGQMRVFLTTTGISYVFTEQEKRTASTHNCAAHGGAAQVPDDPCVERVTFASTSRLFRTDIVFEGAQKTYTVHEYDRDPVPVRMYRGQGVAPRVIESYGRIIYRDMYPGIDAHFAMTEEGLKYEFMVHPGANPDQIQMRVVGATDVALGADGTLELTTPLGSIRELAPESFELSAGSAGAFATGAFAAAPRQLVASQFRLNDNLVSFDVERSGPSSALVIDPYVQWSTYLGGSGNDAGNAVDFLPNGDIIVGGYTGSSNFPTTPGVIQEFHDNLLDGFLARYTSDGRTVWATYLGGSIEDVIMSLHVDVNGDIVAGGYTTSYNFPATPGAFQQSIAGGLDAILMKLRADGTLLWATYFGGGQSDNCEGVATDSQGNIVFTGYTLSSNLPRTANAHQLVYGGNRDAYLAKFHSDGTRMWATYYGGNLEDWGHSVSVGPNDNIFAVGHSHSYNFPTTAGSFQPDMAGDRDGYLLKFDPDGTRIFATLIGSTDWDDTYDIDADPTGHLAVGGATSSPNFPVTPGAIQPNHVRYFDAFVMRWRNDGLLQWSTYIGLSDWDMFHSVATFPSGNMMVAGFSESINMYTLPLAFQPLHGGGEYDMYVMKISANGQRRYGTYLGGSGDEYETSSRGLMSIAVNDRGEAVLTGKTSSNDFPLLLPDQPAFGGDWDATVTKWNCAVSPQPTIVASGPLVFCEGDSVALEVPEAYRTYKWSTGDTARSITVRAGGTYFASVGDDDDCFADTPPITVQVNPKPLPGISPGGPIDLCEGDSITLDAGDGYASYAWSNGATSRFVTLKNSETVFVTVSDGIGCAGTSAPVEVNVHALPQPVVTPLGPAAFCIGESVVLDAGDGFASYEWSTGDTTQTIEVSSAGSYNVRVVTEFGCTGTSKDVAVTVYPLPQPVIAPLGPTSFCIGDSVVLDAGDGFASYRWSNGATSRLITAMDAGMYSVSVTSTDGCVDSSSSITVEVFPLPEPVITALGPLEFCESNPTELDAGPGFASYLWSTGATTRTIQATQTGTYAVTVSTGNGCSATSPDLDVIVYPGPQPDISPSGTIAFCEGDSAVLTAGEGFSEYRWSTGEAGTSIVVTQPGAYSVAVVDSFGCEGTSEIVTVVVHPNPPKPGIRQSRDTLIATTTAASYIWYMDGNEIIGETNAALLIPRAGRYTVAAASPEGCLTLSDPIDIVIASMTVSLPDIVAEPGQRVRIPLRVETMDLFVESGARNFIATIRFDKRILADVSPATGWTVDATSRRLQLSGGWDANTQELGAFEVLAMLGPVKSTDLVIESIEWLEGIVATTRVNGSVTLEICEEGGDRLFDGAGQVQMAQNSPNPFNSSTVLRYELIERGMTHVYVTDVLGRRVATLVSGPAEPGVYEIRFDAGDLPSGRYFAVLQTPTVYRVRLMQLVK